MPSPDRRLRDLPIAPALLAIVVVGSAMAVGTVHVDVLLVVSAFALAGAAPALWVGRREVGALPAPSWVLLGLAAWSALQALPLPMAFLAAIAPSNADVWARSLRPLGEGSPALASISLDPGASLVEALKWTTYAAVFALAHSAGKRHGRYWGPVIVFFCAVAVALVTLVHGLAGANALFGLYVPKQAVPRWGLPPLLNPNNLSGYLNFGLFCGAGLLLTHRSSEAERPLPPEWLVAAGIAAVVGISVLAASRGGILGIAVGAIALAIAVRVLRSGRRRAGSAGTSRRRIAALAAALAGGTLLATLGASEATWRELQGTGAEKLRLLAWSKPLIAEHLWFGVGRGGFETTFPAYRAVGGRTLYANPENFVAQWVAEWGLPVALIAMLLLAWLLRPSRLAVREHRAALGVLVGGAVLLAQNLADLALEVPAVMIALAAAAGSIYEGEPLGTGRLARFRRRLPALAVALTGGAALAAVLLRGRHPVGSDRDELHAMFTAHVVSSTPDWARLRGELRSAMLRHPGEAYFPLLGAMAARRVPGENATAWISAALERDPQGGEAHLILSDILAQRGAKQQALMELRLAAQSEPNLAELVGKRAAALSRRHDDLMRAVPDDARGATVLMAMADAVRGAGDRELVDRLLSAAIARDSGFMRARIARTEDWLGALEGRREPCAGGDAEKCRASAQREIEAMAIIDSESCAAPMFSARLLVLDDKQRAAEELLATRCPGCRETARCAQARLALAARTANAQQFKDAARAALATACSTPSDCAQAHAVVAGLHAQRGEWGSAADHFARALQSEENGDLYLQLARAAARAGDLGRARAAARHAERLGKHDPELEKRMTELESQRFLPGPSKP